MRRAPCETPRICMHYKSTRNEKQTRSPTRKRTRRRAGDSHGAAHVHSHAEAHSSDVVMRWQRRQVARHPALHHAEHARPCHVHKAHAFAGCHARTPTILVVLCTPSSLARSTKTWPPHMRRSSPCSAAARTPAALSSVSSAASRATPNPLPSSSTNSIHAMPAGVSMAAMDTRKSAHGHCRAGISDPCRTVAPSTTAPVATTANFIPCVPCYRGRTHVKSDAPRYWRTIVATHATRHHSSNISART